MDKKNKIILGSGISFASLTTLATIISAFITPEAPDPAQLSPRTKVAYMATEDFARLPEKEKTKYVQKVGRTRRAVYRQLNEKERQAVRKNTSKVRMQQMKERTKKFFAMTEEEQNKYLDERIAQQKQRRAANEARQRNQGNNADSNRNNDNSNSNRPPGNRNVRRRRFLEGTDSTTRAQMREMRNRMRERERQTSK